MTSTFWAGQFYCERSSIETDSNESSLTSDDEKAEVVLKKPKNKIEIRQPKKRGRKRIHPIRDPKTIRKYDKEKASKTRERNTALRQAGIPVPHPYQPMRNGKPIPQNEKRRYTASGEWVGASLSKGGKQRKFSQENIRKYTQRDSKILKRLQKNKGASSLNTIVQAAHAAAHAANQVVSMMQKQDELEQLQRELDGEDDVLV